MAISCRELINDCAKANGKLGPGRTLSESEFADAFRILQRLLDAWAIEPLLVYATKRDVAALVPSHSPITLGPGGDWPTRPLKIDGIGLVLTGTAPSVETPLAMLTDAEYANQRTKDLTSTLPTLAWYSPKWPLGELYLWPVPLQANSVALYYKQQLEKPDDIEDILDLPPGYELALVDQMAVSTCVLFDQKMTPELYAAARESKARVKSANHTVEAMRCDPAIVNASHAPGIASFYSGE